MYSVPHKTGSQTTKQVMYFQVQQYVFLPAKDVFDPVVAGYNF